MGIIVIKVKRPTEATPQRARERVEGGEKIPDIAREWGISRAEVYYLLHRAGWITPPRKVKDDGKAA